VFGHGGIGPVLSRLLILMVLSSSAATTQTTILPNARTTLSMAFHKAIPDAFGRTHPRYLPPTVSTVVFSVVSVVFYAGINFVSGGNVIAGSINLDGALLIRSSSAGSATRWAQICRLVRETLLRRSPTQRLADRIVGVSVPMVLLLGLATAVAWSHYLPFDRALLTGLAVLVVACPCAVGLAAPMASSGSVVIRPHTAASSRALASSVPRSRRESSRKASAWLRCCPNPLMIRMPSTLDRACCPARSCVGRSTASQARAGSCPTP